MVFRAKDTPMDTDTAAAPAKEAARDAAPVKDSMLELSSAINLTSLAVTVMGLRAVLTM